MIKKMILINSAKFMRAEFDLSKETFFVGSNAGGKTTSTRALHFLYNSNSRSLGIPSDKTSFKKHYYPYDNSYIIYTFENFFIFTYKRGDEIHKYFSKQIYDDNKIFGANNSLNEHEDIMRYIKNGYWHHPKTIQEYTDILYGKDTKFKDFSISKIKNYNTFIEILNLVFDVDKAIVDSISIKKAIQKALRRDDEIVTLDFEKYIRKLKEFESSYYFFKTFDKQRKNIDYAVSLKEELLNLEKKLNIALSMVIYRQEKEQQKLKEANVEISKIDKIMELCIKKKNGRKHIQNKKIPKLHSRLNELKVKINELKNLKEKYSLEKFEENSEIANRHKGVKQELSKKSYHLNSLIDKQMSVLEAYDKQIESLEHKIEITIPHISERNIRSLVNSEEIVYGEEKNEIESESNRLLEKTERNIDSNDFKIENFKNEIVSVRDSFRKLKKDAQKENDVKNEQINSEIKVRTSKTFSVEAFIEEANRANKKLASHVKETKEKYKDYRTESAIKLKQKREDFLATKNTILNQVTPKSDTFQEFLSSEVTNWEKELYPILDKSLLSMPSKFLNPKVIKNQMLFGISLDTSKLDVLPTMQEAEDKIGELKKELRQYRVLAHEKFKEAKLEQEQNLTELEASFEENELRIKGLRAEIKAINQTVLKLKQKIVDNGNFLIKQIDGFELTRDNSINKIGGAIKTLEDENRLLNSKLIEIKDQKKKKLEELFVDFEFNIEAIKKQEEIKKDDAIEETKKEIEIIQKLKRKHDENDLISKLSEDVKKLEFERDKCVLAGEFLKEFSFAQEKIKQLSLKEAEKEKVSDFIERLKFLIESSLQNISDKQSKLKEQKNIFERSIKRYKEGAVEIKKINTENVEKKIATEQLLIELIKTYEEDLRDYKDKKVNFKTLISRISELESYPLLEVDFKLKGFDEALSIKEIPHILESLDELKDFKINKYESQKKRSHREFNLFLKNTLPQKLINFSNLESGFLEIVSKINKNLKRANFGVIRDISLETNHNRGYKDSIGKLFEKLSAKIKDSANLYSKESLFFHDQPRSVKNIEDIIDILGEIKKRGTEGTINLFDAISLSISYTENGKKNENKTQIKNDSSSGGNILLKVAIAISILNIYYKPINYDKTPFYLIIDEISRLQRKNQNLLREYINEHGFKTLFITPDALYPDLEKAIYYVFKNIENEGESLRVTQMNKHT